MKTIEQLQAEHAKQLEALQKQHEIADSLPLRPDNVMFSGRLWPWVSYKVTSLEAAINIFKTYQAANAIILPMSYAVNGCAIIAPIEEFPSYAGHEKEIGYCIKIEVSQGKGFGPCCKLSFYVGIAGYRLRIVCDIPDNYRLGADFTYSGAPRKVIAKRPNQLLFAHADKVISFASGSNPGEPGANYVYCFVGDYLDCSECSNAIAAIETIHNSLAGGAA